MHLVAKALHFIRRRHAPCCESTPLYSQKVCALLRKDSTLFARGRRLVAKAFHTMAEDMRFIAKALHLSCRRHAPCCSSALLYLQKACALLQKQYTLFTEGMRLVVKAFHLFAEGVRLSAKALHFSCRRHAHGCKSIPLYLQKTYALLQKHSTVFAVGMRLEAKAFNNQPLPV